LGSKIGHVNNADQAQSSSTRILWDQVPPCV